MVGRIPILLVHGLGDTARLFRRTSAHLGQTGHTVHCFYLVPNNGESDLDDLAIQIKDYVTGHFRPEEKFALVGFSMGGIVSRFYVQRPGGIERVLRFVTISARIEVPERRGYEGVRGFGKCDQTVRFSAT